MNFDDDEFPSEFNVDDILNDKSLHDELARMGWTDDDAAAAPVAPSAQQKQQQQTASGPSAGGVRKASTAAARAPPSLPQQEQDIGAVMDHSEIANIGMIDEENIQLTEDDMADPDLLAQFDMLNDHSSSSRTASGHHKNLATPAADQVQAPALSTAASTAAPRQDMPIPTTAAEAKALAVKCKRDGNDEDALKWFRYSKQLVAREASVATAPSQAASTAQATARSQPTGIAASATAPSSSSVPPKAERHVTVSSEGKIAGPAAAAAAAPVDAIAISSLRTPSTQLIDDMDGCDAYAPLEAALAEAITSSLKAAQQSKDTDKRRAIDKMKEYKSYQQELVVLKSRKQAGCSPALFHWESVTRTTTVENPDIPEDQYMIEITEAVNLDSVLDSHSSRSISISFEVGDEKFTTATSNYADGKVQFDHHTTVSGLRRPKNSSSSSSNSRGAANARAISTYAHKKINFELILHRGFFKGKMCIGEATLSMADMASKCTSGGEIPIMTPKEVGKRAKAVGGSLYAYIKLKSPVGGPEVLESVERKLVIESWPTTPLKSGVPLTAATTTAAATAATTANITATALSQFHYPARTAGPSSTSNTVTDTEPAARKAAVGGGAAVGAKEKLDTEAAPLPDVEDTDLIESNDVLEYEIERSEARAAEPGVDEDEKFNITSRLQMLRIKQQVLICKVQQEALSMGEYLDIIKQRLKIDQSLALQYKARGDVPTALLFMKRVKIMTDEIKNAEDAATAGDGDDGGEDA